MIKKYLMVIAVTILALISSLSFAAEKKSSGPLKIKGFYIGMDIEEAKNRLVELFGDKLEVSVEEITEQGEKTFFIKNVNRIKKEDFEKAYALTGMKGADVIWESLIKTGYINELGRLQDKLFSVQKPEQIEWSPGAVKDAAYAAIQVYAYDILKVANIRPKIFYEILADSEKKVKYIYFSGGASDKLFNTEGVEPTVFAHNFVNAYLFPPSVWQWPDIDPQKVITLWEYRYGCTVIIYSDKSFMMQKLTDKKDFKFD
ncbi:MAG: hypothetical protein ABII75_05150 [Candidatus Omnitrophota bacterium]